MSGSFAFKTRALANAQPLTVQLELTYRCNWRCVFCYNPRHNDVRGLRMSDWVRVLDALRELGTLTIALTGGEPLAHPDFFPIAEAARARAFAIRIFTNGTLIDDAAADRIVALHPLCVELSLHGATADVHDRATARPGSFDAMWAAIDRLVARGAPVLLKTPVTSLNEHQLEEIVALAASRGLALQIDPHITPRDDGDVAPLAYSPSREGVRRAMALAPQEVVERVEGGVNCGLGRITMAIDPEGNVYPCMQWRHQALGNVRETSLVEMWRTSPLRREVADVAVAVNDRLLAEGGANAAFSYCPALAFAETGDVFTPDESFRRRAAIAAELRS